MTTIQSRVYGYFSDDCRTFYLTRSLTVLMPDGGYLTVPASEAAPFATDGPSLPPLLRAIWAWNGPILRAAIVHDFMCGSGKFDAAYSDYVFRWLMAQDGVSLRSRSILYYGLRAGAFLGWRTSTGCALRWSQIRRESWSVKWARGLIIRYLRARICR